MNIRPATPPDAAGWLQMRQTLWPECSLARHRLEMQQLSEAHDALVLVAIDEAGRPRGFAEVSIRHDHVDGAASVPTAYLEGWYVDAEVRGSGLGRQLLQAAEGWALKRGLRELASDVELENETGIKTHLACGFSETCRAVHFIKPL